MAQLNINPQPHQQTFLGCNGRLVDGELQDAIRIVFFGGGAK